MVDMYTNVALGQTFVTHSEEDYNTFNRLFIDTPEALGHRVRVTVWYRPQNLAQLLPPPLSPEEVCIRFSRAEDRAFNGHSAS